MGTKIQIVFVLALLLGAVLAYGDEHSNRRQARSVGGFFRRIFGRRKQGFQGNANVNAAYSAQPSGPIGAYLPYMPNGQSFDLSGQQFGNGFGNQGLLAAAGSQPSPAYQPNQGSYQQSGPISGGPYQAAASAPYTAYAPHGPHSGPPQGNGNIDFHQVLDSFVRSAGLSPNGDHDTSASSVVEQKGDTPVFSFKKLYSFPFYLNADSPNSDSGYSFSIPYMRKHIKRVASEQASSVGSLLNGLTGASSAPVMSENAAPSRKLGALSKLYHHQQKLLRQPANHAASTIHKKLQQQQYQLMQQAAQQQAAHQAVHQAAQQAAQQAVQQQAAHQAAQQQAAQQQAAHQAAQQTGSKASQQAQHLQPQTTYAAPQNYPEAQPHHVHHHHSSIHFSHPRPNSQRMKTISVAPQPTQPFKHQEAQKSTQPIKSTPTSTAALNTAESSSAPVKTSPVASASAPLPVIVSPTATAAPSQDDQQSALIQQAIANPQAFISQFISQHYAAEQLADLASKPTQDQSAEASAMEQASAMYFGQPQVSVSSSTSSKVSKNSSDNVSVE